MEDKSDCVIDLLITPIQIPRLHSFMCRLLTVGGVQKLTLRVIKWTNGPGGSLSVWATIYQNVNTSSDTVYGTVYSMVCVSHSVIQPEVVSLDN